jgi:hypothetical protein
MAEYDRPGRDAFLSNHGFRPPTKYLIWHDGKTYDSKAIAGVAHGIQFPDKGVLTSEEFTGGAHKRPRDGDA